MKWSALLILLCSNVFLLWRTLEEHKANEQWREAVTPAVTAIGPPIVGYSLETAVNSQDGRNYGPSKQIELSPSGHATVVLVSKDNCAYCAENLARWRELSRQIREIDAAVKIIVVDLFRAAAGPDSISFEIAPDERVIPSSDTALMHRFYQATMTIVIGPDRRYRSVELGVLSNRALRRLLDAVKTHT